MCCDAEGTVGAQWAYRAVERHTTALSAAERQQQGDSSNAPQGRHRWQMLSMRRGQQCPAGARMSAATIYTV